MTIRSAVSKIRVASLVCLAALELTAAQTAKITATAGTGGTVTPSGVTQVALRSSLTIAIQAKAGYEIAAVVVDGVNQGAIPSYTFTVTSTKSRTLKATFRSLLPAVPTGLATRATSGTSISVSWSPVSGATSYDLQVDGTIHPQVTTPFRHSGVVPGSSHTYQVRACSAAGASAWSSPVTQRTGIPRLLEAYAYSDLVEDPTLREPFYLFAQSKGIGRIYLEAGGLVRNAPQALAAFIAEAKGRGLAVCLLTGDADWTLPDHRTTPLAIAQAAASFADSLRAAGQPAPDGIQYDVEPYLLDAWDTDMQGTANHYLDLLLDLKGTLNGQLPLTVAIPFWFDGRAITRQGVTRPLSEWVIDSTDGTVMMDYRDTAGAIVSLASTELAYASQVGKPLTVAVDVKCGESEPEYITFCEEGEAVMREELAAAQPSLDAYAGFAGYAVFYAEAWANTLPALAPRGRNARDEKARRWLANGETANGRMGLRPEN